MIYDRVVTVHDVTGGGVLGRRLSAAGTSYYCARQTVGIRRYYTALQIGDQTDDVVELPGVCDIRATQIAIFEGHQHRILQVQHATDKDGLPVTVLSLSRLEDLYELEQTPSAP